MRSSIARPLSRANAGEQGEIFCGDNLDVLRARVADASIDLVYLDPPFFSQRSYRQVVRHKRAPRVEIPAFDDVWTWGAAADRALAGVLADRRHPRAAKLFRSLRELLDESDLLAYLAAIAPRAFELHRALKPSGTLYLHCDPTASHYLKLVLDATFGARSFKNEVIWRYRRWPTKSRAFQRMHDVLLVYVKDPDADHVFHTLYGYEELAESTKKTFGDKKQVADFSSGRRKPSVREETTQGPPMSDVWEVSVIAPIGKERLGYPTQKPEALLERVIRASSDPGMTVLDPYCGSGTTLAVAAKLGRKYLGIDKNELAVAMARRRLAALDCK